MDQLSLIERASNACVQVRNYMAVEVFHLIANFSFDMPQLCWFFAVSACRDLSFDLLVRCFCHFTFISSYQYSKTWQHPSCLIYSFDVQEKRGSHAEQLTGWWTKCKLLTRSSGRKCLQSGSIMWNQMRRTVCTRQYEELNTKSHAYLWPLLKRVW